MDVPRERPDAPASAGPRALFDASTDAAAVVSGHGVVLGWTRAAEELLGLPASGIVGSSAARLLAMPGDPLRVAGVADRCRAGMGWSGHIPLRHSDGSRVDVDLRVSAAFRVGADECFLISAREQHQQWAVGDSVLDGFLTRAPVGMAVMDTQLRYIWLNDTLERFGGVPRAQRLGRRLSELLPGLQADTIEGLMRKVLETGVPVTDYEYVGWSWADPRRQHAYSTSFFPSPVPRARSPGSATWSRTSPNGGTPASCCPWSTRPAPASAPPWTCCGRPRSWPISPCPGSRTSSSWTCWSPCSATRGTEHG